MHTRHPADGMRIARITVEFLAPVPRVPPTMPTSVLRDGRRIRLFGAALLGAGMPADGPGLTLGTLSDGTGVLGSVAQQR